MVLAGLEPGTAYTFEVATIGEGNVRSKATLSDKEETSEYPRRFIKAGIVHNCLFLALTFFHFYSICLSFLHYFPRIRSEIRLCAERLSFSVEAH